MGKSTRNINKAGVDAVKEFINAAQMIEWNLMTVFSDASYMQSREAYPRHVKEAVAYMHVAICRMLQITQVPELADYGSFDFPKLTITKKREDEIEPGTTTERWTRCGAEAYNLCIGTEKKCCPDPNP